MVTETSCYSVLVNEPDPEEKEAAAVKNPAWRAQAPRERVKK